ncbi:hypothetical protein AB1046_13635 [Promicromonospora sp. Populi]|uniref:hypothetical protein n=1 Tax=Promicromonospora sp. Populi TaxID=3239420 RepID=UPI0034E2A0C1
MRVISLLRSAVAGPRQRPIGALAILTVIFGVVTMHSMSGSPTSHLHAVPHEAPAVATEQAATEQAATEQAATEQAATEQAATEQVATERVTAWSVATDQFATAATADQFAAPAVMPVAETPDGHSADEEGACEGCCGQDLATAMCLMILVGILALVVPAGRLLWRAPLKLAISLAPALAAVGALAAPSLHELCISRT